MRNKVIVLALIIISFIAPWSALAQDFDRDMAAMKAFYLNQQNFQMEVVVKAFNMQNQSYPLGIKETIVKKQGNRFLYKMDKTEMLLTENELIMVNHADKFITFRSITKKEYKAIQEQYSSTQLGIDSGSYDSVSYGGLKDGKKYYTVFSSKKLIQRSELVLDAKDNFIRELIYFYNPKMNSSISKAEVQFLNVTVDPVFAENIFSESRFIIKTGKTVKPAPAVANYNLKVVSDE